jgi:hypothetical protein
MARLLKKLLRWLGTILLFATVAICFTPTLLPIFLDRFYYRGPATDHFDGARFANPGATRERRAARPADLAI